MSEGGFGEALGQKIGPLPGWGWALVVGGGLGLSMLLRKKSTAKVAPSTVPGAVVGGTSGADSGTGSTLTAASDIVPYTDNNTWGLAVETALLQAGAEPTLVDQAVRDYLAGDSLTPAESVLIGQALNKVGPPPELLPPGASSAPTLTDPTSSAQPTTAPTPPSIQPGAGAPGVGFSGPALFKAAGTGGGALSIAEGSVPSGGLFGQTQQASEPGQSVGGVAVPAGAVPYFDASGTQVGWKSGDTTLPLHPVEYSQ